MSGYSPIKNGALSLDFVRYFGGVVGFRSRLIHVENCGYIEDLYYCGKYEKGGGQMMTLLVGRCCDDETHSTNDRVLDDAVMDYVSSMLA